MPIPLGILAVAGAGGGGGAAFEQIATTLISTTTASVTFTSGGAWDAYKHLELRVTGRHSGTFGGSLRLIYNGAAMGSSYNWHRLEAYDGSGPKSGYSANEHLIGFLPGNSIASNVFGASIAQILDINGSKNKTTRALNGMAATSANQITLTSGLYMSTTALTEITASVVGLSFLTGSRLSLYGIKG
jgi:hypothetical protein